MKKILLGFFVLATASVLLMNQGPIQEDEDKQKPEWLKQVDGEPEKATFAGGCFWCTEAVFQKEKGVSIAVSGFTGGREETARYRQVASGGTEHREAVQVTYYPSLISYEDLLDIYWRSIDPTDDGGQFVDRGYQYTTAIYAHDKEQYLKALESRKELNNSGKFEEPIVTEVKNLTEFYPAREKHQNYSMRNELQYTAYKEGSGREKFLNNFWENNPFK